MTRANVVEEYIQDERQPEREPHIRVTGLMIQYYHVCKRELWFFSRGIDIDRGDKNIQRGTYVDENSYEKSRRSLTIDNRIQLDLMDSGDVMEIKVSSALEKPARMQLLFYLWYLREVHDVEKSGVLAYPQERTRESVELTSENVMKIEETIQGIFDVVTQESPPELDKKSYCESCLYQDLCWL